MAKIYGIILLYLKKICTMFPSIKIKLLAIPAFFLCGVIFCSCHSSKQIQGNNIVVKWEVEFKPGLSLEQKNKVMQELDREIIKYAYMATLSSDSAAAPGSPAPAPPAAPGSPGKPVLTLEDFGCYNTVVGHTPIPASGKSVVSVSFDPCGKINPTRPPKKVIVGPATLPNPIEGILNIRLLNLNQR